MKKKQSKKKDDTMNKGEIGIKEMLDYQLDPREYPRYFQCFTS